MEIQPPSRWPLAPLIFPPTSNVHKSTFIILHGQGSTADKFASPLLTHLVATSTGTTSPNSSNKSSSDNVVVVEQQQQQQRTFQSYFPSSKFIFPTAQRLRARAYNRSLVHQWFDCYPFDSSYPADYKSYIQSPGLRDSVRYVHELLNDAVREVGGENVVLIGLSMGCATALVSLLLWEGEKLGGVVGMCGCLPFVKEMDEALLVNEKVDDDEGDLFERDADGGSDSRTAVEIVIEYLREELDLVDSGAHVSNVKDCPPINIPVFLGHGTKDDKVPVKYGREAATLLRKVGVDAEWKEYDELHHWYSAGMLRDIIIFLRKNEFDC